MSAIVDPSPLDRLLEPLAAGFTSEMARYIAEFRADAEVQSRIERLAEKANEGELTPDERREYEEFVEAGTLIAILQAKARKRLNSSASLK
jgi:hypothetical protein